MKATDSGLELESRIRERGRKDQTEKQCGELGDEGILMGEGVCSKIGYDLDLS